MPHKQLMVSWSHSPGPYASCTRPRGGEVPTYGFTVQQVSCGGCRVGGPGWAGKGGAGGEMQGKVSPSLSRAAGGGEARSLPIMGRQLGPEGSASLARRRPTFRSVSQPACARCRSRRVTPELSLQVHLVRVRVGVGVRVRVRVGVRVRVRVRVGVRVRVRVRVLTSASDRNWLSSLVELRV